MGLPTAFNNLGSTLSNAANYLTSGQLGTDLYNNTNTKPSGVVAPATLQLGNAIPAQPSSLAGLLQSNKGYVNTAGKTIPAGSNTLSGNNSPPLSSLGTNSGLLGSSTTAPGAMTSTQIANQQHNAALMAQYGPGNYTIDANGNVLPKTTPTPTVTGNNGVNQGGNIPPTPTNVVNNGTTPTSPPITTPPPTPTTTPPNNQGANFNGAITGLLGVGAGNNPQLQSDASNIQNLQNQQSGLLASESTPGLGGAITASDQVGQKGVTTNLYSGLISNAQAKYQNDLAEQGQQTTAYNNAGGLASPGTSTQQVSPGNAVLNSQGNEIYSGIGGLTGLGIAQQNIKQGQGYAQQSADLGTALQGINTVGTLANQFLQNSGLNQSSSPFFNKQQNTTLGQLKAGDISTYNEMVNQIQTYANQIFASTGMTPTDAGNLAKSISIDGMTAADLTGFLKNLDTLGQARKAILDTAANSSYASGTTPYTGPTTSGGTLQTTSSGVPLIPSDPTANFQAIVGGLANFGGDIGLMGSAILGYLGLKQQ